MRKTIDRYELELDELKTSLHFEKSHTARKRIKDEIDFVTAKIDRLLREAQGDLFFNQIENEY